MVTDETGTVCGSCRVAEIASATIWNLIEKQTCARGLLFDFFKRGAMGRGATFLALHRTKVLTQSNFTVVNCQTISQIVELFKRYVLGLTFLFTGLIIRVYQIEKERA